MSIQPIRFIILFSLALAAAPGGASAQEAPKQIVAFAKQYEADCEKFNSKVKAPPEQQISTPIKDDRSTIYVVDSSKSACAEEAPMCGTGGCMVAVFRVTGNAVRRLFADQALGWKPIRDGKAILFDVNGGECGGAGPDPCVRELDLVTGRKRTFSPKPTSR